MQWVQNLCGIVSDSAGSGTWPRQPPIHTGVDGSVTLLQLLRHTCVPLPREGSTEALMNLIRAVVAAVEPVMLAGWRFNSSSSCRFVYHCSLLGVCYSPPVLETPGSSVISLHAVSSGTFVDAFQLILGCVPESSLGHFVVSLISLRVFGADF